MNGYFYLVMLTMCLVLAFLVGCSSVVEPPEPPELELYRIEITPNYTEILAGHSVQLTVTGYSKEGEEVSLDEGIIYWSKCCPSGMLSPLTGYTTIFKSARSSSGIMQIYCSYEELSDEARILIIGVM